MKKYSLWGLVTLLIVVVTAGMAWHFFGGSKVDRLSQITSGGDPRSASEQVLFDLSFCDDTLMVPGGTLCAIKPSATDERIRDVAEDTGLRGDLIIGFGYHVVAIPDAWTKAKIWMHFTGTSGRPYDQRRDAYETRVWLSELMQQGYVGIQLAYDNRFSVNGDLCGKRNEGHDRDNCAGEVREINLTGEGSSPYRSTDEFNTIDYRLSALIAYLKKKGVTLPGNPDPEHPDWSTFSVSGHSQGANQAYYIAKKRSVAFACIIAGGYDSPDSVNPGDVPIADWFTAGTSATPTERIGAFLTTTDDSYRTFYAGLTEAVGLPKEQVVISDKKKYFSDEGNELTGHGAAVKDPSLAALRAEACFR